ncbi:MAG: GNAT family N-acetyltransferase [Filimonas sp.]|nr:GNAT family N-acetyltransferase [Filimonas sp.]
MSNYYLVVKEGHTISTDPAKLDLKMIHQYLSEESYWAKNIPLEVVERGIANSIAFGMYEGNKQIGFARVITDKATFAYLADVFILAAYRGKGLSKWLMQVIHAHPELQSLRRWMLVTRDAHGLYEQNGWTAIPEELVSRIMQKHNPDIYKQ